MGPLLGLAAGIGFGLSNHFSGQAVALAGVRAAIFWNLLSGTALLLLPTLVLASVGAVPAPSSGAAAVFFLSGLASLALGRTVLFQCMTFLGASRATAFRVATPLVTALLAVMLFGEQVSVVQAVGIVAITSGLIALGWQRRPARATTPIPTPRASSPAAASDGSPLPVSTELPAARTRLLGFLAGIAAALCFSTGDLLRKGGMQLESSSLLATTISTAGSLVVVAVWGACTGGLRQLFDVPRAALSPMIKGGTIAGISVLCFFGALHYTPVAIVTPLASTQALFVAVFSRLLAPGSERIDLRLVVSVCVMLGGVVLVVV